MNTKDIVLFKGIPSEELQEILRGLSYEIKIYKKDEYVAFRGDRVPGLMIVLKGILNAQMLGDNGKVQVIERLKEGTVVASAFIFGERCYYPVDLFCESSVELFYIKRENIYSFLSKNQTLLENFLSEISNKAQFLSEKLWKNFSVNSIREKLEKYIEENREDDRIVIPSVKELAENFGVARPSLSRVLKEMVEENSLQRVDRNIYIILEKPYK